MAAARVLLVCIAGPALRAVLADMAPTSASLRGLSTNDDKSVLQSALQGATPAPAATDGLVSVTAPAAPAPTPVGTGSSNAFSFGGFSIGQHLSNAADTVKGATENAGQHLSNAADTVKGATENAIGQGKNALDSTRLAVGGALGSVSHTLLHGGEDCWNDCMKASGPCLFCGEGNLCCSANSDDNDENTRTECKAAGPYMHDGSFHECVSAGGSAAASRTAGAANDSGEAPVATPMAAAAVLASGTDTVAANDSVEAPVATTTATMTGTGTSTAPTLAPAAPVVPVQGVQTIVPTAPPIVTTTTEAGSSSSGSSSGSTAFWIIFAILLLCCCLAACGAVAMLIKGKKDKKNKARAADHEFREDYRPSPPIVETPPPIVEERVIERAPEPVVEQVALVPPIEQPVVAPVPAVTAVPTVVEEVVPMAPAVQPIAYTQPIFGPIPTLSTPAMMQQQPMMGTMMTQPMMQPMVAQPAMGGGMFQFR